MPTKALSARVKPIQLAGQPAMSVAIELQAERAPRRHAFYLRALAVFYPATKERCSEALRLFERAIGIGRHYGPALASAAFCHMVLDLNGWAEEPEPTRRKAEDLARRALQAAQNDPRILANTASALAYCGEDIGAMMALADRALAINPSYVRGWYLSGVIRLWGGQLDLVIEHIETALRLSPREYLGLPLHVAGMAYFFKGNAVAPVHPRASGAMPAHTEALPRAMPTWDASMKRAK